MSIGKNRWQAPGNAKLFDSPLESKGDINERSIGVLKYIKSKGYIEQEEFELNIKEYLFNQYRHVQNKSVASHFFRPLLKDTMLCQCFSKKTTH